MGTWGAQDCAIGIDVGGTKIAAGMIGLSPIAPQLERTIPTRAERGGAAVLADTFALAQALCDQARSEGLNVAAIGVGVPELVAPDGRITSAYNFDWRSLPVAEMFSGLAPMIIEADVRAAALAEARIGVGQAVAHFAYVSIGTGISYTLVNHGVPYAGARGNALILASGALTHVCPACGSVHRFVLEEYASGPALVRRYNEQANAHFTRAPEVFAALEYGDPVAHTVIASAGDALGVALGFMVNLLDPALIVIGGGLGLAGGLYREHFLASMRDHIWSPDARDLPVHNAHMGGSAGWIGAALAAVAHGDESRCAQRQ